MSVFRKVAEELRRGGPQAARIYEDFENGIGTYLKVVRFPEPTNPDGLIVLYLCSSGTFLLLGYWRGYERSVVAGRWSRQDNVIHVDGRGEASTDAPPDRAGRYERELHLEMQNHTPVLVASAEMKDWSLLGWTGPFVYAGRGTIIDPDGQWLPKSSREIEDWIRRIVGNA